MNVSDTVCVYSRLIMFVSILYLQELLKKEKQALRKEKKAERMENVYLAEEETEKKIVQKKEDLARAVSSNL